MNIRSALNIPRKYFRFFFKIQEKWKSYILNKVAEVHCPAASLSSFLLLGFNNLVNWNLV